MNEDGTPATLSEMSGKNFAHLLEYIDVYLCELTGAQIRNGLHILGNLPNDEKLTDLLFSLCRLPNIEIPGIRDAQAQASGIPLSSLLDIPSRHLTQSEQAQFSWLLPFHDQKENFSSIFILETILKLKLMSNAYTRTTFGQDARSAFRTTLARVTVATKNQDNREHDIFDSNDYLQFHGGMIATIQALTGKRPTRYIGDTADPQNVRVRDLQEEALRVFRSRVVNPKWLASMREHGYKGGLELSATMDYIFGYDATSDIVNDWMYKRVAQTYVLEFATQNFLRTSNPWALRDIATRLFEANNRGLWKEPDAKTLEALRDVLLQAEADIE